MGCKYVKREGESCTLNNNCKYPDCEYLKTELDKYKNIKVIYNTNDD